MTEGKLFTIHPVNLDPELNIGGDNAFDKWVGTATQNYIDGYFGLCYSSATSTSAGLGGIMFDNVFGGNGNAGHLDQKSTRIFSNGSGYAENGGILTYSIHNKKPSIPLIATNLKYVEIMQNPFIQYVDGEDGINRGDGTEGQVKKEYIAGNMNDDLMRCNKYFYPFMDIGAFESSSFTTFMNEECDYLYTRLLARDKCMSRMISEYPCCCYLLDYFASATNFSSYYGAYEGGVGIAEAKYHFCMQLVNELSWMSLVYGFHPNPQNIINRECGSWSALEYDEILVNGRTYSQDEIMFIRDVYGEDGVFTDEMEGYTTIFEDLHDSGWNPETNVIVWENGIDGDNITDELVVEVFGGDEYPQSPGNHEDLIITVLNNKEMTTTLTDVHDIYMMTAGQNGQPLYEMISKNIHEKEVDSGDCSKHFPANLMNFAGDRQTYGEENTKSIKIQLFNLDDYGLEGNNARIKQLVHHDKKLDDYDMKMIINDPEIISGSGYQFPVPWWPYHLYYTIGTPTNPPTIVIQKNNAGTLTDIHLDDKALLVFQVWAPGEEDNGGSREERIENGGLGNPFFESVGNWMSMSQESANGGELIYINSNDYDSYSMFRYFVNKAGDYKLYVRLPDLNEMCRRAVYEVYYVNDATDELNDHCEYTFIVDQSSASRTVGSDGLYQVGNIRIDDSELQNIGHIVVKVRSIDISGENTKLVVDAMKLESVNEI